MVVMVAVAVTVVVRVVMVMPILCYILLECDKESNNVLYCAAMHLYVVCLWILWVVCACGMLFLFAMA